MIDITPYQERLQWLQEWMHYKIESNMKSRTLIRVWKLTGMMYYSRPHTRIFLSFEEYCAYKKSIK